jgi:toxin ParE1/3/4
VTALRIAPQARRDLASIWSYTAEAWGRTQADDYTASLYRDMDRLRDFPDMGSPYVSRVGHFRKLSSGHHLIFYVAGDNGVEIVRVLHERMDVGSALDLG